MRSAGVGRARTSRPRLRRLCLLTLHRPSNVDDEGTLVLLLQAIARIQAEIPMCFPSPRTRRRLEALASVLPPMPRLHLPIPCRTSTPPADGEPVCAHRFRWGADETTLGIPCLTLRHNTERPITVTRGTNRIVGTTRHDLRELADPRHGKWPAGELPELWDGKAAGRIVRLLVAKGR